MAETKPEDVVRQFQDHVNDGNFEAVAGLFAEDALVEMPTQPEPLDAVSYVGMLKMIRASFPDWTLETADVIARDALVAVRGTHTATFDGEPFMGLEPNGREFAGPVHPIFRIQDGKIQRMWGLFDTMGFMAFIGATNPPKLERPPMPASR